MRCTNVKEARIVVATTAATLTITSVSKDIPAWSKAQAKIGGETAVENTA